MAEQTRSLVVCFLECGRPIRSRLIFYPRKIVFSRPGQYKFMLTAQLHAAAQANGMISIRNTVEGCSLAGVAAYPSTTEPGFGVLRLKVRLRERLKDGICSTVGAVRTGIQFIGGSKREPHKETKRSIQSFKISELIGSYRVRGAPSNSHFHVVVRRSRRGIPLLVAGLKDRLVQFQRDGLYGGTWPPILRFR